MDINSLPKGESYKNLKESYIVFVCSFDPFHHSNLIYTFRNKCIEIEDLELDDKATKIFLNATGIEGKINLDIKNFLKYINNGEVEGDFTNRVDNKLKELKSREEIGVEYMTYELMLQDARDEAREEAVFITEIKNIKRLIDKMHMTIEEAMDFSDIPEKDREKYTAALINS